MSDREIEHAVKSDPDAAPISLRMDRGMVEWFKATAGEISRG
jgi:hypothetical protein